MFACFNRVIFAVCYKSLSFLSIMINQMEELRTIRNRQICSALDKDA